MKALKSTTSFQSAKAQGGFTLIELVMVIVILGILSAFALPRFADVSTDARKSTVNALAGAIKSAASIAHSSQLVTGAADNTPVSLDNQSVTMIAGYPTADAGGIVAAANIDTTNDFVLGGGGSGEAVDVTFQPKGKAVATCQVTYTSGKSSAAPKSSYKVTVVTTGC
jgi:MSHA pilin protein MshA